MKIPASSPDILRARVLQLLLDGANWTKAKIDRGLSQAALKDFVGVTTITIKVKKFAEDGPDPLDNVLESLLLADLVTCPQAGVYRITAAGRAMAKAHPDRIPDKSLAFQVAVKTVIKIPLVVSKKPAKGAAGKFKTYIEPDSGGLAGLGGGSGMGTGGIGPASFGKPGLGGGALGYPGLGTPDRIEVRPRRKGTVRPTIKPVVIQPDTSFNPSATSVDTVTVPPPVVAGAAVSPPAGDALSDELLANPKIVPVWYGTNRRPKDFMREDDGYSGKPDKKMHYGYCEVNVPAGYVRGGSGRTWLGRLIAGEPTKLKLGSISPLEETTFWLRLVATLKKQMDANSMLLFVHGYRVSFEDAANSAGQLSYELQIPAAFFSWTSRARFFAYDADEEQVDNAVQPLKAFIEQLSAKAAATGKKLHVIAHSMGNRALMRVLHDIALAAKPGSPQIAQVIFAAPDMPREKFLELLAVVVKQPGLTAGRTLYAANDKALWGSGVLHINERAGYLPPVTTAPELETVDVSKYNLSWLGHSYVFRLPAVLEDIASVINGVSSRRRNRVPGGSHWVLG